MVAIYRWLWVGKLPRPLTHTPPHSLPHSLPYSLTHSLPPHPFFAVVFGSPRGCCDDTDCLTSPSIVDATFSVSFSCFRDTSLCSLLRECSIFNRVARVISPSTACNTCTQLLHLQSSWPTKIFVKFLVRGSKFELDQTLPVI